MMLHSFDLFISLVTPKIYSIQAYIIDARYSLITVILAVFAKGISEATFDKALADFTPIERIIKLDRNQPEFTQTLDHYLAKRITNAKIARARELLEKHKVVLAKISKYYEVQPRFIVTLWGLETNFGSYLGKYNVPQALATLAYDGRRGAFFRKELFNALQILDEGHISLGDMKGGWAGAVGQPQFLPSSFLNYRVSLSQRFVIFCILNCMSNLVTNNSYAR